MRDERDGGLDVKSFVLAIVVSGPFIIATFLVDDLHTDIAILVAMSLALWLVAFRKPQGK